MHKLFKYSATKSDARLRVTQLYNPRKPTGKAPMKDAFLDAEFAAELGKKLPSQVVSRRHFLRFLGSAAGAMAVSGALASCSQDTSSEPESSTDAGTKNLTSLVRLSSVVTPQDGGLYDDLLPDFERQTGGGHHTGHHPAESQPRRGVRGKSGFLFRHRLSSLVHYLCPGCRTPVLRSRPWRQLRCRGTAGSAAGLQLERATFSLAPQRTPHRGKHLSWGPSL